MTITEAKQELKQYKHDLAHIECLEHDVAHLTEKIDAFKENNHSKNLKPAYECKLEALYEEYIKLFVETYQQRLAVEKAIRQMPQPHRRVITLLYINDMNLHRVADELNYNYSYASRLHKTSVAMYAERRAN